MNDQVMSEIIESVAQMLKNFGSETEVGVLTIAETMEVSACRIQEPELHAMDMSLCTLAS